MKMLLAFASMLVLLSSAVYAQDILFSDDFTGGMDGSWLTPNGGWVWEDGHIVNTSTCGYQSCMPDIWAGGSGYSDYYVSFDLCLSGGNVTIYVMANDAAEHEQGQTAGLTIDTGIGDGVPLAKIWRIAPWPNAELLAESQDLIYRFDPEVTYRVKFGRFGDSVGYKKWPVTSPEPTDWLIEVVEETRHEGYWGISFWNGIGTIDNFLVEKALAIPSEGKTWGGVKAIYR